MKFGLYKRFLSVALIAASATTAYAGERPRDTGVGCNRAANAYCKLPDESSQACWLGEPDRLARISKSGPDQAT